MIIRLTWQQWAAVRTRIPGDLERAMVEHRQARGRAHDYLLPAIGWRRVLDALIGECYGPLGGMRAGGRNNTIYRAIAKIAERVGTIESHPALTPGRGVLGANTDVIPAWVSETGARSPYPLVGWDFMILRPHMVSRGGRDITLWSVGAPEPENMLEDEAFHVALSGTGDLSR